MKLKALKTTVSNMKGNILLLSSATLLLAVSLSIHVAAQDSSDSGTTAPGAATTTSTTSTTTGAGTTTTTQTTTTTLQGGVQKVELSLDHLRDVGVDLKNVLKATSSLHDEVTMTPVRLITEPEMVGRGIVINIPIGTEPIGPPAPARKDRVDLAMSNIKPVIDQLKKNVDAFMNGKSVIDLPGEVQQKLQPDFQDWISTVNDVSSLEKQLEQATQGPTYDNGSIASLTVAIQNDVKKLDDTRRDVYNVIRKEGKRIAAAGN